MRYWPRTEPVPKGWVQVCDLSRSHHGRYSVLIEKKPPFFTRWLSALPGGLIGRLQR